MIKNAMSYITRKGLKSLIIFLIILVMSSVSLISLSVKEATNRAAEKTFNNITNSFTMEINRRVNFGTPRGGGNIKSSDIKKIAEKNSIDGYVKRIGSVADLVDYELVETAETLANKSPEKTKNFNKTMMLTGVNDSSKESKFVSGAYKLVEGKHLNEKDAYKVLIHKDLASKNNLKIGDKFILKSNIYDADNEKKADERIEVEIKGLFDGHNKTDARVTSELYENTLITDIHTAANVYGNNEDTAVYQDATFFVKGDKNLDNIMKEEKKLDINWEQYNIIKSSSNYPALQKSIADIYSVANKLLFGALLFSGLIVSLLLFLWINTRKKEVAILLSLGISRLKVFQQFVIELIFVSIPAFVGAYFLSDYMGKSMGNKILTRVNENIVKDIMKQSMSTGLGGGAEVDGFNKTLIKLDVSISIKSLLYVILFMTIILIISLSISSVSILRKKPRELLSDTK